MIGGRELNNLLYKLEADPVSVQLQYGRLRRAIAKCMDEIYELAKSGEDNDRKMKLVAIEYRARLVLERFRKRAVN